MPAKKTNNKKTGSDKNTEPKAKKEAKYNRQLRRSESDKIIAGVAGGIGQFFDIDPTFIRLIFVLLSIFGGGGVLLYFVLWLITPSENSKSKSSEEAFMENKEELKRRAEEIAENVRYSNHEKSGGKNTFAYILIILGVFFLLNNMGFFDYIDLFRFWPMILVVFGLLIIFNND